MQMANDLPKSKCFLNIKPLTKNYAKQKLETFIIQR